jgi:hypothetical protein
MASEIKVDTIVNAGGDNDSGIDLSTNDNIKFDIAGSQKAIIDSSGNLAVGLSSGISSKLHVASEVSLGPDGDNRLIIGSTSGGVGSIGQREAGSSNFSFMNFTGGKVGINTASPVTKLHVNADSNDLFTLERSGKSSGSGFFGMNIETNSQITLSYDDGAPFVIGTASDPSTASGFAERFAIAANGDLTATDTSISSNSDERLKKNIADFTYDLEKFKQYKPKTFDWKNPSVHNGKTGNRGFLAQDVKSIDDKWVGETEITEKNPDYGIISDNVSLTSKLGDKDTMYISVIQQLITKVETLEAKVKELESK